MNLDGEALANVGGKSLQLFQVTNSVFSNLQLGGNWALYAHGGTDGNTFTNVHAAATVTAAISGFQVDSGDDNAFLEVTVSGYPVGFRFQGDANTVSCSRIVSNVRGLDNISGAVGTKVNRTVIAGNTTAGVRNNDGETLDATVNYWGAASGPAPGGTGDVIDGSADATGFVAAVGDLDVLCGRNLPPAQSCAALLETINAQPWAKGTKNSFAVKAAAACRAVDRGQFDTATNILGAVLYELDAQLGVGIDAVSYGVVGGATQAFIDQLAAVIAQ